MKPSLTTKELAQAIGVSESSLKRWADDGAFCCARTPGGHRRIALAEAIRFIRRTKANVVRPDLLGFSDVAGPLIGGNDVNCLGTALYEALCEEAPLKARNLLLSAFLEGRSVASLCDGPVRFALTRIGELWPDDADGILIEHLATDTILQTLHVLRTVLPTPGPDAPGALGGAPPGDPYLMPSLMTATVLAEVGFRDLNLGPDTPATAMVQAIRRYQPKLVWLALNCPVAADTLDRKIHEVAEALAEAGGTLIVGGRSTIGRTMPDLPNLHLCQSMTELACYTQSMAGATIPQDHVITQATEQPDALAT